MLFVQEREEGRRSCLRALRVCLSLQPSLRVSLSADPTPSILVAPSTVWRRHQVWIARPLQDPRLPSLAWKGESSPPSLFVLDHEKGCPSKDASNRFSPVYSSSA